MDRLDNLPEILTPGTVARLFAVDPKTVYRWAIAGKLPYFRTPGGHCRFERDKILKIREKRDVVD